MEQTTLQKLYEPFDVKTKPGGGNYKYIKSSDAIDRMNKTFAGNWTTEVVSDNIIEDTIVVRILVSVYPQEGDNRMVYTHEGYGSSPIKRYSGGANKGKIVNLGSDYKAASSMAIRNACSRWGVGLHLEEDRSDGFDIVDDGARLKTPLPAPAPAKPMPASTPPPAAPPVEPNLPPASPPTPPVVEPPPVMEEPKVEAPVVEKATPPTPPPFPAAPKPADAVKEAPAPTAPPTNNGGFPKIPMPTAAPTTSAPPSSDDNDMISDVQKAALNGLLTIRGLEYNKLATDAFTDKGMDTASIPQPDDLTYKQAVVVIKYGNDLFKKKN